jgi:hypothetical protein
MKVLYLATRGPGDPTKASIPLHIATDGSVEAGLEFARMTEQFDRVGSV